MALINGDIRNFRQLMFLGHYLQRHNGFIAGGCFKNVFNDQKVKDVDVFFETEKDYHGAVRAFNGMAEEKGSQWSKYYRSKNVTAFKSRKTDIVVEFIKSTFGTVDEVLNSFDFTIAKFAYYTTTNKDDEGDDVVEHKIRYHNQYFEHLHLKRLVADDELRFPVSSFHRMIRYIGYGYKPCKETRIKLLTAINELPSQSIDEEGFGGLYDGLD